ncbi:MAG: hypothetical protein KUG64_10240 [Cycloclasticus sp.]|nr:hypothetical protein [Cycloclasticus sp.]
MKAKLLKDMFIEEKDGKYSSKKIWGAIIFVLVCAAFIMDGLKFYTANKDLFIPMLTAACTLIGLGTLGAIFKRKAAANE